MKEKRQRLQKAGFTPLEAIPAGRFAHVRCGFLTGFTLIELMIVVVILGLLATIVMPRILDRPEQARRMKAKVEIRYIETTLALFITYTGRFPTTTEGPEVLVSDPGIRATTVTATLIRCPWTPGAADISIFLPGCMAETTIWNLTAKMVRTAAQTTMLILKAGTWKSESNGK